MSAQLRVLSLIVAVFVAFTCGSETPVSQEEASSGGQPGPTAVLHGGPPPPQLVLQSSVAEVPLGGPVAVLFSADAGFDAGTPDAGVDAGTPDAGVPDAGAPDAGEPDAGVADAGAMDAGRPLSGCL